MIRRPLPLHAGNVPPAPVETAPVVTLDQRGLPPAGWDRVPAGGQGGARARYRKAVEPVQFKSAGPAGCHVIKRGR